MSSSLNTMSDRFQHAMLVRQMLPPEMIARTRLSKGAIYNIINHRSQPDKVTADTVMKVCQILRIRPHWLLTGEGQMELGDPDSDWANIEGFQQAVAMGDGAEADEYAEAHKLKFRYESLRRKGLHQTANLAVYYGSGDSMEPRIKDGDAILFDKSDIRLQDGKIYIVHYDGHLYAKRMIRIGEQWCMASENTSDPQWRKPIPIDMSNGFQVVGRVRWIGSWED